MSSRAGSPASRRRNNNSPVGETVGSQRMVVGLGGVAARAVLARERAFFAGFRFIMRTVYTTPRPRVQSAAGEVLDAHLRKDESERHGECDQESRNTIRQRGSDDLWRCCRSRYGEPQKAFCHVENIGSRDERHDRSKRNRRERQSHPIGEWSNNTAYDEASEQRCDLHICTREGDGGPP